MVSRALKGDYTENTVTHLQTVQVVPGGKQWKCFQENPPFELGVLQAHSTPTLELEVRWYQIL